LLVRVALLDFLERGNIFFEQQNKTKTKIKGKGDQLLLLLKDKKKPLLEIISPFFALPIIKIF